MRSKIHTTWCVITILSTKISGNAVTNYTLIWAIYLYGEGDGKEGKDQMPQGVRNYLGDFLVESSASASYRDESPATGRFNLTASEQWRKQIRPGAGRAGYVIIYLLWSGLVST